MTVPTAPGAPASRTGGRSRRRSRDVAPVPYDFRRPIQLSREHSRILQLGFDGFARQATTVFTSALRTICSVTLASIDQRSYAEYVDSRAASTYLTIFSADPMPGRGLLELPLPATMACVDHMLGGPGGVRQPDRPLSEIESTVIRGFIDRLLAEMRYSLEGIVLLEPTVTGVEYSPQFAQVAAASDVMVLVSLDLKVGETEHVLTICLPFAGLLPHLVKAAAPSALSDRERAQRARAAALLNAQFQDVPVEVAVRLRTTRLDAAEVGSLAVGDVVRLAHPAAAPLDVTVDGATFAYATPGANRARLAALIVAAPPKETR